jgi:pimeloyl-ACP methyl ester carboxylesterase
MFLSFKNGKIHYTDSGVGEVIVLLHGYLESLDIWQGFAGRLASCFRVISMDLPGHGMSDVYGEIHSIEFMASALKGLLDREGINRVFLVGHSMGGYVSLAFLELYPEYLSGYCLFHSHPLADSPETVDKRINDISIVLAGKKDLIIPENIRKMYAGTNLEEFQISVNRSIEIALKTPDKGITAVLSGMMARPSRIDIVEEGKVPFLWILGALDNHINCGLIQQKVKLPVNSEVVILNNSGHMGFIEEEDMSLKAVEDFAKKLF